MRYVQAGAVLGLAAIAAMASTAAFSQQPIKIGVMYPLTGPLAGQGGPTRDAVKQAFEEEGMKIAGRKVELLYEDSAGRPDTGLTKMKSLVERSKVHLLVSELVSSIGAAVAPYVREKKIPWISNVALASLTRAQKSPYIFRFVPSSYQFATAAAEAGKKLGWKKVYFLGWNAPPGREAHQAVVKVFGKENVVDAMFPNVGTSDYAPYLTKMDPSKAQGLFTAAWGADSPRIVRQFVEYGLKRRMSLFGIASFTSEEQLAHMPLESVGVLGAFTYCGTFNSPENKKFVDGFVKRYKKIPGSYQYMGYMAAKMTIQAIKDIKGKVEDREALVAALNKVKIKGPMGEVSFDENRGMVADFHMLKVVKGPNGKLQNECGAVIPKVRDPYDRFP